MEVLPRPECHQAGGHFQQGPAGYEQNLKSLTQHTYSDWIFHHCYRLHTVARQKTEKHIKMAGADSSKDRSCDAQRKPGSENGGSCLSYVYRLLYLNGSSVHVDIH